MTASLYIHVPFCAAKCDYCDFYSVSSPRGETMDAYVATLCDDVARQIERYHVDTIPTVYIGGGTPTILGARRLDTLLSFLRREVSRTLPQKCLCDERTIEANPESLDETTLETCLSRGINRISLGIQSLDDDVRKAAGRRGSACAALSCLEMIKPYTGGITLSCDLISGLPGQTEDSLRRDIASVIDAGAAHISLYDLTIAEGTPLARRGFVKKDDDDAALFLAGRDELLAQGYEHYEVSNFCRSGARCRHNIRYWHLHSWLGAGCAASGTIIHDGICYRTVCRHDVGSYTPLTLHYDTERLSSDDFLKDMLHMGFRYCEGPDAALFKARFGVTIEETIPGTLKKWRSCGMMCAERRGAERRGAERCALNEEGLLFLNRFLRDAFLELDAHRDPRKRAIADAAFAR